MGKSGWRRNLALMEVFSPGELTWRNGDMPNASISCQPFQLLENHWGLARKFRGLDRELFFSFALHLPEQLLVKVDRASMAWSLEARSPLLDRDFVEFCARIPQGDKLRWGQTKCIFKEALAGILPPEILSRGKQGFIPPLGVWLRRDLRGLLEESLLSQDSWVAQWLGQPVVHRLSREHLEGQKDHQRRLYALLNLELWAREFLRQPMVGSKDSCVRASYY
jgi:asparagine synthase (glutamine-hydrolysing)